MRPETLMPLVAGVTALKGVGPGLAKPGDRRGIARVVDAAFHLPTGVVDRLPREELDQADVGRTIAITLTPVDYRQSAGRSEEHTSELQSLMRISYAVFCLKKKNIMPLPR